NFFGANLNFIEGGGSLDTIYKLDLNATNSFAQAAVSQINFTAHTITDTVGGHTYDTFRLCYTGAVHIDADGTYYFKVPSADGVQFTVDNKRVIWAAGE